MAKIFEGLGDPIVDGALAPWPQARFLIMTGLMACLPRAEDDAGIDIPLCPALATTVMVEASVAPMTITTADGVVVIDPNEQMPFLNLLDLIDRLSRHEDYQGRIDGFEALLRCALCTPDWADFA